MKSYLPKSASLLILFFLANALALPVMAADKKDKNSRRLQQMVQQAQQEKAELQTQVEQERQAKVGLEDQIKKTSQEADSLKGNLNAASRKASSLAAELQRSNTEKQSLETKLQQAQAELEGTQKSLSDLTLQYQQAQQNIKSVEREKVTLSTALTQKEKGLEACQTKNEKLYGFGLDLIKIYERPSTYEAILRTEPFTQIKRAELESQFQDYQDKLENEHLDTNTK